MTAGRGARARARLGHAYAALLRLYPRDFREEYGPALRQVFDELARDAEVPGWRLWLTVLADVPGSVVPERLAGLRRSGRPGAGLLPGVAAGLTWTAYNVVNQSAVLDAGGGLVLNDAGLAALALLFALTGFAGVRRAGRIGAGVAAALRAAALAAVIGIATMWIAVPVFYADNFHNPGMLDDLRRSGMRSMDAFIVADALSATLMAPALSLLLGALAGGLGGALGLLLRPRGPGGGRSVGPPEPA